MSTYLNILKTLLKFFMRFFKYSTRLHEVRYVIFVHDAHKHGAQFLGLNIAKVIKSKFGENSYLIILLDDGPLMSEFSGLTSLNIKYFPRFYSKLINVFLPSECLLIYNSIVTQKVSPFFQKPRRKMISLIHELPGIIKEHQMGAFVENVQMSSRVVFPSIYVMSEFNKKILQIDEGKVIIKPQGFYNNQASIKKFNLRDKFRLDSNTYLICNLAYGDLRKGFDVFIRTAIEYCTKRDDDICFIWFGNIEPGLKLWALQDIEFLSLEKRIIFAGFQESPLSSLSECDCLLLTSREDPYPSTILESVSCNIPCILYDKGNGYVGSNSPLLNFVPYVNIERTIEVITKLRNTNKPVFQQSSDSLITSMDEYVNVLTNSI